MEPEGSLPLSLVSANCPYPQPARSSQYPIPYFLNIHLNIILPSTPGSPKWSLSFRLHHQIPEYVSPLPHTRYVSRPYHLITQTILGLKFRSFSSSLCSFLHSPVTSSFLRPNIPLSTLFSNTLSQRSSSLNVSDHVSHPYNTTGKIIVPYILTTVTSNVSKFVALNSHVNQKSTDMLLSWRVMSDDRRGLKKFLQQPLDPKRLPPIVYKAYFETFWPTVCSFCLRYKKCR